MKKIKVAAAVITDGNRIFATQRGHGNYKDWWEFPGGKIEPGESPEECLVRECREELEIDIEVLDLFEQTKYSYPERDIEFMFFSASLKNGSPTPSVHKNIKWVSPDKLQEYEFCPADVSVIEKLAKGR